MIRKMILGLAVVMCMVIISSCDKDDDDDNNTVNFSGTMNGANEVPAVTTTATGNVTGSFNETNNVLTLNITYAGLSSPITVWHVHKGAVGVSGPPVAGLAFGTLGASPFTWSDTLDATMEADLKANLYYVNIHTTNNVPGEIRGQLNMQ